MFIVVGYYGRPSNLPPAQNSPANQNPSILTANTLNPSLDGLASQNATHAQLAAAFLPPGNTATKVALGVLVGAFIIWAARHLASIRKALRRGERFVLKNPLLDVLLISVMVLSFLLVRSAGLIQ